MALVIDILAETVISNLLGAVTSLLKDKVNLILNAKDELKQLQGKLERLQKALKDADRKPFFSNERNRDLEGELKGIFYDAQDIIEEYQTIIELSKREKGSITSWNKVRNPWITLCSCFKEHVYASYQLGNEVKKINQTLDEIEQGKEMVDFLKTKPTTNSDGPTSGQRDNLRETTHHIGAAQPYIGRADDKEKVKELLFDGSMESSVPPKHGVSIVSIVGQGGIGKTTLAKMVFKEVEEQFGKRRWWVCVSQMPNPMDLLQKILKEVCKGSESEIEGITSLSDLCTRLQSELSNSKFLLVLDDVWELDWWWGEVEDTLMGGAKESNILITSRKVLGIPGKMHKLSEMTFDESWRLFLDVALKEENELVSHNLKGIGETIVGRCGGLPLVVKTVGSLMRTKRMTKPVWESVVRSEIWEWKMPASSPSFEIYGSILPGLILSYDDLSPSLKSCFVYCCIYPKDYVIEREKLVMQWVAHELIDQKKGSDVEVTANQCIDDLINLCMIEETEYKDLKLHDILHDLALYIGGKEYSHASPTEHTRHLSLLDVNDAELTRHNASAAANKSRTLLTASLPSVHFTNFKWLRVLSLKRCEMDELPNSIESLSLLKYLDLSYSNVRRLPSSIGRLCNLQTLDLYYSQLEELPKEMGELCNLRHLGLECTVRLNFIAEGMGKLTNLRTLRRFLVCDDKGGTRGSNIGELKELNKLEGQLSIEGLGGGRVKVIDAKKAHLKEKHELKSVELIFKVGDDDKVDTASEHRGLLEALEPPHGIENLAISDYEGERQPVWYWDTNYVELRTLRLQHCRSWTTVIGTKSLEKLDVNTCPMLYELQSMPLLKSLSIFCCEGLNTIADMPALKSLNVHGSDRLKTLANMPALESLKMSGCGSLEQVAEMPALRSLNVRGSNELKTLTNMPALESLEVGECGSLEQVADVPALKSLEVYGSNRLKTLTNMPALDSLVVGDCGSLEQVSDGHMPALKTLRLLDLNALKQLPAHLPSLEELRVWDLPNWEGWPAAGSGETTISSMPCLREADFYNCPNMQTQGLIYAPSELARHGGQATQLQRLSVLNCKSARLGWKLLEHLPNLIKLTLDREAFESTLPSPLPSEVSRFLPSLKALDLRDTTADKIKWGRVPEWVWGLSQLEDLFPQGFTEDISLGGHWQCLPKLKYLTLAEFPNLKSLVDVNNITPQQNDAVATAATTCPTDAKEQIAYLSKLERLAISRCRTLDLPQELKDRLGERLCIYS